MSKIFLKFQHYTFVNNFYLGAGDNPGGKAMLQVYQQRKEQGWDKTKTYRLQSRLEYANGTEDIRELAADLNLRQRNIWEHYTCPGKKMK